MVFEKLVDYIAESRGLDKANIALDSTFADLGLDSLDTVELAIGLEDVFGVAIEMEESLKTVGDLVAHIEKSLS